MATCTVACIGLSDLCLSFALDARTGARSSCAARQCSDRHPRYRFGWVVAAVNCETGQEVAIKLALEQAQQTSAELREVVLQACLRHEYIVPILDILYDPIVPALRGARAGASKASRFLPPVVFACSHGQRPVMNSIVVIIIALGVPSYHNYCTQVVRRNWVL